MTFKQKTRLTLVFIALTASNFVAAQVTLLNASYDVSREFYKDVNAAFIASYKKSIGKDLKIDQSHGGSSAQARAVNDGLDADVVTMNTTTDVNFLAGTGVVAKDWATRFPNNAAPTSLFAVDEFFGSFAEAQKVHFNDGGQFDKLYTVK
jgi:sulfate transport system substrate-binding protein